MGMMERLGGPSDDLDGFRRRQVGLMDPRAEVAAFYELGNHVTEAVPSLADIVDRHDAWMIQIGQDAGFFKIGLDVFRGGYPLTMGNLDGHLALQRLVPGLVNDAKATSPKPR